MDNQLIYEKFDWDGLKESALKDKIAKVLEFIPEDVETILDIGCGNGVITNIIAQKYKVTAVDRSRKALLSVKTNKILASADQIPLPSEKFDMVFSSEMLEHLEEPVLNGSIAEFKRLSKKYIFITVPNDENPDKLSIQCPKCNFIYNRPNHLRSFDANSLMQLFPEYQILNTVAFGKRVRYYNPRILNLKRNLTPSNSWVPYYWIPKTDRQTICPQCEHAFIYDYKFHPFAFIFDVLNVAISPKKPYWLFILMEKK